MKFRKLVIPFLILALLSLQGCASLGNFDPRTYEEPYEDLIPEIDFDN